MFSGCYSGVVNSRATAPARGYTSSSPDLFKSPQSAVPGNGNQVCYTTVDSPPLASIVNKEQFDFKTIVNKYDSSTERSARERSPEPKERKFGTEINGKETAAHLRSQGVSTKHEEQRKSIMANYRERAEVRRKSFGGVDKTDNLSVEERRQRLLEMRASYQQRLDLAMQQLENPKKQQAKRGSMLNKLVSYVIPVLATEEVEEKAYDAMDLPIIQRSRSTGRVGKSKHDDIIIEKDVKIEDNCIVSLKHASFGEAKQKKTSGQDQRQDLAIVQLNSRQMKVERLWPVIKLDCQQGCVRGAIVLPMPIPSMLDVKWALTPGDRAKALLATSFSAAGGGIVVGATGAGCGGIVGTSVGTMCGLIAAPFTLGISIIIGAGVGGGAGVCIGTAAGSSVGTVGGGAAGLIGWKLRWVPLAVLDRVTRKKHLEKSEGTPLEISKLETSDGQLAQQWVGA